MEIIFLYICAPIFLISYFCGISNFILFEKKNKNVLICIFYAFLFLNVTLIVSGVHRYYILILAEFMKKKKKKVLLFII